MEKIDKQDLHNIFCGIKRNEKRCFEQLYEKYRKLIYAIAFSILKNNDVYNYYISTCIWGYVFN